MPGPGFGSICNLLELDLQMPITKVDIKNPTTIEVGLYLFMPGRNKSIYNVARIR